MSDTPRDSRRFLAVFPAVEEADFRSGSWRRGVPSSDESVVPLFPTTLHAFASAAKLGGRTGVTLYFDDEDAPHQHRTYAQLWKEVKTFAAALAARGVIEGDRVLMVLPTSFEFLVSFFAIQRLGAIPVPSYPPAALERVEIGLERLGHIGRHAGASFCVTTKALRPVLGDLALRIPTLRRLAAVEALAEAPSGDDEALRRPVPAADDIGPEHTCFLQYTSGSTGHPKGVELTHANITANIHSMGQALHISRKDSLASWLPLYHDMGLIGGMLSAIYWRMPLALMPPTAFLMRPVRWLRMISEQRATLSPAPNFAYSMCLKRVRPADRRGLDLSSWRLALNGAEPVNARTVREFCEAFAPYGFAATSMYPVYGLAESALAVAFPRPGAPMTTLLVERAALAAGHVVPSSAPDAAELLCCGTAMPGHDVAVVDAEGKLTADGEVGHVVVRGPSVMKGYFHDPEVTRAVLRDGWLWTGDLGFFGEGGLYVAGRAKDLIIVRGKNFYAEDVERVVEAIAGARPGGVVAFGLYDDAAERDKVVVVCETKLEGEADRAAFVERASEAVQEGAGLTVDELILVAPGTIPKTSSGKRQRGATRQRYLDETLVPQKTGTLKLAHVFARSAAGMLTMLGRQVQIRRKDES